MKTGTEPCAGQIRMATVCDAGSCARANLPRLAEIDHRISLAESAYGNGSIPHLIEIAKRDRLVREWLQRNLKERTETHGRYLAA